MMYTFEEFLTVNTQEEAKSLYHRLARENHPDFGGTLKKMQALNADYAQCQANFAHREARQRQAEAHAANRKSAADFHDMDSVTAELKTKIESALNMGLDVELCGLWAWVSGDTRPCKEELKAQGFKWAPEKKMWYFAGVPSFNRQRRTIDEIREMHGSTRFSRQQQPDDDRQDRARVRSLENAQGL